jgi:hypothetical protein
MSWHTSNEVEIRIPPSHNPWSNGQSFLYEAIMFLLNKAGIPCKITVLPEVQYDRHAHTNPYENPWQKGYTEDYNKWKEKVRWEYDNKISTAGTQYDLPNLDTSSNDAGWDKLKKYFTGDSK